MRIQFVKPDLHALDQIRAEALVVCLFQDERPPRGLAGLLDWRLCGRLSDMLIAQRVSGTAGEAVLFPSYGRLPFGRVCAFGLGAASDFTSSRAREVSGQIATSLHKLRVGSFATALPGSPRAAIAPRVRLELLLEELTRVFGADDAGAGVDAYVIEPSEHHRELAEVVSVATRRWRGIWK